MDRLIIYIEPLQRTSFEAKRILAKIIQQVENAMGSDTVAKAMKPLAKSPIPIGRIKGFLIEIEALTRT